MKSEKEIDSYGTTFYYKYGTEILHREDGPAMELSFGSKFWYLNGEYLTEKEHAAEMAKRNKESVRFVCSECGSANVNALFIVNVNTKELISDCEDYYCEVCEGPTNLEEITED